MSVAAYACEKCAMEDAMWRIERRGDATVTWACTTHLGWVAHDMQRMWENTTLIVNRIGVTDVPAA